MEKSGKYRRNALNGRFEGISPEERARLMKIYRIRQKFGLSWKECASLYKRETGIPTSANGIRCRVWRVRTDPAEQRACEVRPSLLKRIWSRVRRLFRRNGP